MNSPYYCEHHHSRIPITATKSHHADRADLAFSFLTRQNIDNIFDWYVKQNRIGIIIRKSQAISCKIRYSEISQKVFRARQILQSIGTLCSETESNRNVWLLLWNRGKLFLVYIFFPDDIM